jgi:glyoxylase-like metal-dependent hydrolase (beta-lactamase superfamily II)
VEHRTSQPNVVIAVRHGEVVQQRRDAFLDAQTLPDPDDSITLAYYFWVIRTPTGTIIVDTGFDETVARRRGRRVLIGVPRALEALGIAPDDDIDVILTHAHYDHIGNVRWFSRARLHMAAAELTYWTSPESAHPDRRTLVEEDELAVVAAADSAGRLRLVEHEYEIAPGVTILAGPGHTPGELMVRVDTADGGVLLTSDAVHFDEELESDRPFRHMCDVPESRHTYEAIRAMHAAGTVRHVVSGHDSAVSSAYPPLPGPIAAHAVVIGAAHSDHLKKEVDG